MNFIPHFETLLISVSSQKLFHFVLILVAAAAAFRFLLRAVTKKKKSDAATFSYFK